MQMICAVSHSKCVIVIQNLVSDVDMHILINGNGNGNDHSFNQFFDVIVLRYNCSHVWCSNAIICIK